MTRACLGGALCAVLCDNLASVCGADLTLHGVQQRMSLSSAACEGCAGGGGLHADLVLGVLDVFVSGKGT